VGQSVADSLVAERNDITAIDTDAARLSACATWSRALTL
jgi:Trk K+ transport system NAD-binding subunit